MRDLDIYERVCLHQGHRLLPVQGAFEGPVVLVCERCGQESRVGSSQPEDAEGVPAETPPDDTAIEKPTIGRIVHYVPGDHPGRELPAVVLRVSPGSATRTPGSLG